MKAENIKFVLAVCMGLMLIPVLQCTNAQKSENNQSNNQPKVNINVKKQRDQNGNITSYDSTYTWSWSGNGNTPENIDSIFNSMNEHFSKNFSFNMGTFHNMPFGFGSHAPKDSLKSGDSFNEFFGNDWPNIPDMDKMIQQQQKMMEEFFNRQPLLKVPEEVEKPAPQQKKEEKPKKPEDKPKTKLNENPPDNVRLIQL